MISSENLSGISNKIKWLVNNSPLIDAEKNMHALLNGMLTKMELVTREEFDIQAEVLRNTRQKLDVLEAKLAALEGLDGASLASKRSELGK
ncbi:MAG: accessory factor UbiK family protein [Betaproteobacteria bacterium]